VAAAFRRGGPLARALPAFEPRQGQQHMAAAVSDVLAGGGVLLAEAGTGTGKTLAYLVPAILSRQRVLVSTGTKNLQEQIYFKDLPVLREALRVPFTAAYMKGRNNFLCLHRFETFRAAAAPGQQFLVRMLEEWLPHTETGDRSELEDLPDDLPAWNEIAATTENCIGTECPRYQDCFVTRMRQRAAESDLVIVNHHLLCADAAVRQSAYGEVIPDCHHAVIDEAHQLEDVATQYFGVAVSTYRFDELARDGERLLGARVVPDPEVASALADRLDQVRVRAQVFFTGLHLRRATLFGGGPGEDRQRYTDRTLEPLQDQAHMLGVALEGLEAEIGLIKDAPEDLLAIARRAGEIGRELRFLLRADDPDYVYFLETRGRGLFLRASPIDVSGIVRELLLDRMDTTILTSATLAVDGSFEYVKGRLGIGRAREIRLASEFDYGRQAVLYLPRRMPDPRAREFAAHAGREVVEILTRTEGRAFVLFTSYANLREVHAIAAAELDYPLLVQGTAPRSALLRDFRATPHAVLLATSSFWQGVDVAGEALSCVIVDKLPFASPGDPITAARIEAIRARGGEPFGEYQVPLAILTLQQGLGRLIRHRLDRGVLAILDPRLRTKGYGRRFLQSLPPAPVIYDLAAIDRFFAAQPDGPRPA
jgi:ATP-dependent DNA helicase DinG